MQAIKTKLSSLNIDFVGKRRFFASISAVLVVASWVAFFVIVPNWGIDFTGGTEMEFRFSQENEVGIDEIREALIQLDLGDEAIQGVGDPSIQQYAIRIQDPTYGSGEMRDQVEAILNETYGNDWIQDVRVDAEVGVRMAVSYEGQIVTPKEIETVLAAIDGVTSEESKENNQIIVKLPGLGQIIERKLRKQIPGKPFEIIRSEAVGPKVGGDLKQAGFLSIAITLILVLIYVAFRFDISFSPGAVVALFHDVSLTIGVFALSNLWGNGLEINLAIIGALLTIVGYSLNDTIVIYDRIRENTDRYRRKEITDLINVSINETMARTLATSVTTFLAVSPFLFLGGNTIQTFALAMLLGIVFGTYSTVYVASPMILVMQDVKPWLSKMVVLPSIGRDDEDDNTDSHVKAGIALSQSEQRRRERAQSKKPGQK
jgi:preprotein translocase subunit SecF